MTKRNLRAGFNVVSGFGMNAFSRDELEVIHTATLHVFRNTGLKIESEKALEIFHGAGAFIERHGGFGIVKFPAYIVEDCIRWAPKTVVYYGRRPEDDFSSDTNRVGFSAGFGEHVKIIDPRTRELRPTVKKDLADISRIQDYLDVIAVVERAASSGDRYAPTQPLHNYDAIVNNTSKHVLVSSGGGENTKKLIEIAETAVGGKNNFINRPTLTVFVTPTSPLTLVRNACETIIECARGGIGIGVISMSLAGATAPATLGSQVVQCNTEVLGGLILAQLTVKGTAVTYCGCSTIMDMRYGSSPVGVPENAMLNVAWAKLAQYYGLPSLVGGSGSDSKLPDAQHGYDFSLTAIPAALAGANLIFGIGALESALSFDYAAMIMGAEQAERILKVLEGIDVSDEALALDLLHEVGPGGEFMTHEHTYRHMKKMSRSKLFDRQTRDDWMESTGGLDLTERAYQEAIRIMETHTPVALPKGAADEINTILKEYEIELQAGGK